MRFRKEMFARDLEEEMVLALEEQETSDVGAGRDE